MSVQDACWRSHSCYDIGGYLDDDDMLEGDSRGVGGGMVTNGMRIAGYVLVVLH